MIRKNDVKKKLLDGEVAIGTFIKMTDPSSVEILGLLGFEFIVIDSEHVAIEKETISTIIRTAELYNIVPIVRVKANEKTEILQALDSGALGVQIPNVDTVEEAQLTVESTKYKPIGERGFAPSHRAAGYGLMDKQRYIQLTNDETMIVIHCESKECIDNLDEILKEPYIDVVFIGPMDLSQSLGVIGQGEHPVVRDTILATIQKVIKAGKIVGTVASNEKEAKEYIDLGVKYVTISSDQGMIGSKGKEILKAISKTKQL